MPRGVVAQIQVGLAAPAYGCGLSCQRTALFRGDVDFFAVGQVAIVPAPSVVDSSSVRPPVSRETGVRVLERLSHVARQPQRDWRV